MYSQRVNISFLLSFFFDTGMKSLSNLKAGIQFRTNEVEQASVNPRRFINYENE